MASQRPLKQRTLAQKWRAVSLNNKLIVIFSGMTMLATIVYTSVAGWTLSEIHSGSKDTHDLALAAKAQAEKMTSMSDAADKIRQAAEGMTKQETRLADSAEKSISASSAAVRQSIETARAEQRAWVSASVTQDGFPKPNSIFEAKVVFQNTGRTPAQDVRTCVAYKSKVSADGRPIPATTSLPSFDCQKPISPRSRNNRCTGNSDIHRSTYCG